MKNPVHPGRIIKNAIEASGLNVTEAAKGLGVTRQTLSRVINAKTALSAEMAIRVSKAFGSSPEHWLRMQMAYDLAGMKGKVARIKVKRFPEPSGEFAPA